VDTYNGYVAEDCADAVPDEPSEPDPTELAEYVRQKLNVAMSLACNGELERRSGRWESAEQYQRKWQEAIAEVKRLLPLMRKRGISLFRTRKLQYAQDGIPLDR
jgi:hypothetical protein